MTVEELYFLLELLGLYKPFIDYCNPPKKPWGGGWLKTSTPFIVKQKKMLKASKYYLQVQISSISFKTWEYVLS